MRNIVQDTQFLSQRAEELLYFQDQFHVPDETETSCSPSGKFKLEIHHYYHKDGIRIYTYTKGIVTDIEDNLIDIIYRNYDPFVFSWAEVQGKEYLLCGLDYQGYTIVDLFGKETKHYVPEAAYKGHGFCWAEIICFEQKKLLVVDGCYWAAPYELVFYDFSNPLSLPYKELFRVEVDSITNWNHWREAHRVTYVDEEENEKVFVF
ncbi:hypothetical protein [Paenibacillus tianjinensis]|uniref:WG containing repeat-containing protein n=1 Tax=Paenibacillus tianjinensis TaxID=2810347 RepID=A0ABX7LBV2_9BACL|nr:hypothetical protein [Paenibacillus tianjinensis]QSF45627.1 hypothetical protein JRJ22_02915 [Paenibacillus tianjinensis]